MARLAPKARGTKGHANRFQHELTRDFGDRLDELVEFQQDITLAIKAECESRTPTREGEMKRAWDAGVGPGQVAGRIDPLQKLKNPARLKPLSSLKPFEKSHVVNTKHYASFVDQGTVQKGPRPIVQPALMAVNRRHG